MTQGFSIIFKKEISAYSFNENEIFFNGEKEAVRIEVLLEKIKSYLSSEGLSFFQKQIYNGLWISEVRSMSGFVMFGARNQTQMEALVAICKKIN